jgi:Iodothyronine deiodinase
MRLTWKKGLLGLAGVAALGAAGFYGYYQLVKAGILRYNKYDRREKGKLQVGDQAPDLALPLYDGGEVKLSELWRARPVVLVFGSCTWPPFRKKIGDLHRIYDKYKDRAEFLTVYISEAHPDDEWQMDSNHTDKMVFKQPKTFEARKELAAVLVDKLKYRMPLAVDTIDNKADQVFAGWPERIYVLEAGGRVKYKGGMGPFGFHPDEAEKVLATLPPPPAATGG